MFFSTNSSEDLTTIYQKRLHSETVYFYTTYVGMAKEETLGTEDHSGSCSPFEGEQEEANWEGIIKKICI